MEVLKKEGRTNMPIKPETAATAALAYLGDAVLELRVRSRLVGEGIASPGELNRRALAYVRATAQSAAIKRILPDLTETETAVYRRGRNADHHTMPKSASPVEYRTATGFEALFGYLYLSGQEARADELFAAAYADVSETDK